MQLSPVQVMTNISCHWRQMMKELSKVYEKQDSFRKEAERSQNTDKRPGIPFCDRKGLTA